MHVVPGPVAHQSAVGVLQHDSGGSSTDYDVLDDHAVRIVNPDVEVLPV